MIERILNWFRAAKPQPSLHDAAVQIGCHYEEVAEMVEAVDEGASMPRPLRIWPSITSGCTRIFTRRSWQS